jgi:Ca2+-binding EF-hand superfamily protein
MGDFGQDDERVGEIVQRIQVFVQPRRIRMREFFYDFDPLRCGRCSRPQFHRGLTTLGMNISDPEAEILTEYFIDHGPKVEKPAIVNYYKFCDMVDEVFIEGNPDPLLSASSPGATMMSSFRPNDFFEEELVMHVLHRVAALCKTRGIHLKAAFTDHSDISVPHPSRPNPRRGGKCTMPQFLRSFPFTKDMGESDINLLMERYRTKTGDFHYQALHNDVSAVTSTAPPPFPTSPLVLRPDQTEWGHHALDPIQKLKSKTIEKRIRLYEHFQDFDPLRKGFCTVGQVKCVFTLLNLGKEINKADFDKLTYAYMREDGMFCFADFCADVDSGFGRPGLEKEPLANVAMPDASTTAPARRNTIKLHPGRRDQASLVEERIRTRVRLRRILIKPMFVDMDKAKRGFITRNQFARAMGSLGFDITEIDVGLLSGVYCNYGNHLDFNYVDFCKSVDPPDDEVEVAMQQANAPFQDYRPSQYFTTLGKVSSVKSGIDSLR